MGGKKPRDGTADSLATGRPRAAGDPLSHQLLTLDAGASAKGSTREKRRVKPRAAHSRIAACNQTVVRIGDFDHNSPVIMDFHHEFSIMPYSTYNPEHTKAPQEISDEELVRVIADFLAAGHVDNIVAMIRQEPHLLAWTGHLLEDERYSVRIGVLVLFEHLIELCPAHLHRALPGLIEQLRHPAEWVRGEAASVLGIIGSDAALAALSTHQNDPSSQVVEIIHDILNTTHHG